MFHVTAQPTQSGAQRLLALDQREEQARQLRVPLDAGPAETRFSRVLALFLDEELNPFLSELTADPRCSEEALRQLEGADDRADTVRPSVPWHGLPLQGRAVHLPGPAGGGGPAST